MTVASTRHAEAERLSAWISGDLSERETASVRAHVESCSLCADVAASLREQVVATRALDRPEPPPTLWSAIEGALDKPERRNWWSWPATLTGALAGAVAVALLTAGGVRLRGGADPTAGETPLNLATAADVRPKGGVGVGIVVGQGPAAASDDPMLREAERELEHAAVSYERAVGRLRKILEREQRQWDPETRARVSDRMARLDESVAQSRAVARRDPGDSSGADMLFSAYQRQIDFLAEAVHRGSPAAPSNWPR